MPRPSTESPFLKCFGVGDGMACADRNHSSYLYGIGGATVLVDCGEPVSRSFQALRLDSNAIDRVFLSHLHSDHVGGFFMLLQGFWLGQRKKPLRVHLPADGITPLRQMLTAAYLFDELFKFELIFEPLEEGRTVKQGTVQVTPFRTTHLDRLRQTFQGKYPGDYAAYSFLIEAGGLRIGHSADLGAVEDLEPLLARPLDLLVCELSHFTPRRLFSYLRNRDIRQTIFTHLGRRYWEDLAETRRLARTMLPGVRFAFARDQEVFRLR
jgi:ribonuclease BN (tRNA processing enzyme)